MKEVEQSSGSQSSHAATDEDNVSRRKLTFELLSLSDNVTLLLLDHLDYDDIDVENRFLSRMEWQEGAERKMVRVYDESAHQWHKIGEQLGLEHGQLLSIQRDYHDDRQRVTRVLGEWCENASNLRSHRLYPKTWSGLIALLNNSDLGTVAMKVHNALSASRSTVQGNVL